MIGRKRKKRSKTTNKNLFCQTHTRIGIIELNELFSNIPFKDNGEYDSSMKRDKEYFGYSIHMNSLRYAVFKFKGVKCAECGLEGKFFSLDLPREQKRPHFNLYGVNSSGEEILMTKDHIHPKSLGGDDSLDNLQPMCCLCNFKKGARVK